MEPKLFETWSRSRNYLLLNVSYNFLYCSTVSSVNIWQELELEPEPKLWTKVEPEPKINNFRFATLPYLYVIIVALKRKN